jgi:acetyl-CoA carboxylase biotin carboxyl carrier protein
MTTGAENPRGRSGDVPPGRAEDDIQRLNELLEVMHEHDLDALTVTTGETTYELVRREPNTALSGVASGAGSTAAGTVGSGSGGARSEPSANVKRVIAPLTGVFYNASSPDAEPFVKLGDRVEVGAELCILEAMKLFNEIQSDYAGTILRIVPQNGELVSQGEELFWIEP